MGERPSRKTILSPTLRKIFLIFADTLIPPTERLPQKPSDFDILSEIEDALFYSSGTIRNMVCFGLRYFNWRARLFRFSFKTFTRMNERQRSEYLESWFRSPLLWRRSLIRLFGVYVLSVYYSRPEITKTIGYQLKLPNKTPSKILYGDRVVLDLPKDEVIETDVCVVGSGAGGAPLAAQLAESGLRVVILEEGGRFDLSDYKVDAAERSKRMYRDAGITSTVGVPPVIVPLGKTIGGTTTINSGTCFRTPEEVFQKWAAQHGLQDLNSEVLAPYYEKVEKTINVVETPEDLIGGSGRVVKRGLEKMGHGGAPLRRNVKSCEGSGLCCFGCPTDAKQSTQLNYIPQALENGARLFAHCKVLKIVKEGNRVREVTARFIHPTTLEKGSTLRVRAKVFVVAAGTVHTPLLLKASGIGRRSGQLGKNLTLHPAGKAMGFFEEEIRGWEGVPQSYYCPDFKDQGIMFEGAFTPPSVAASIFLISGREHKRLMEHFAHIAVFGFLITDESRGRVIRRPNGEPLVFYSLGKSDRKKFIDGLVVLCRIFFEAGAREVYLPVHTLPVLHSAEEIPRLYSEKIRAKDLDLMAFHPLGTCRMGKDPSRSVLDSYGRVHEMENLYVTDGSVFPSSLGVNPQVTIMALSHRTAEWIRKNYF